MKHIIKVLIDIMFLFPIKLRRFKNKYKNDRIVAYGACKGIQLESEEDVTRGLNWVLSKRGFFILSDSKIVMGDWKIELTDIEKAELMEYRSGMVLKITLKSGKHYQFGLQFTKELLEQEVLDIVLIKNKVKYSKFSIILRFILIIYLAFIATKFLQ